MAKAQERRKQQPVSDRELMRHVEQIVARERVGADLERRPRPITTADRLGEFRAGVLARRRELRPINPQALAKYGVAPTGGKPWKITKKQRVAIVREHAAEAFLAHVLNKSISYDELSSGIDFTVESFVKVIDRCVGGYFLLTDAGFPNFDAEVFESIFDIEIRGDLQGSGRKYRKAHERPRPDESPSSYANRRKKTVSMGFEEGLLEVFDRAAALRGINRTDFMTEAAIAKAREMGIEVPDFEHAEREIEVHRQNDMNRPRPRRAIDG